MKSTDDGEASFATRGATKAPRGPLHGPSRRFVLPMAVACAPGQSAERAKTGAIRMLEPPLLYLRNLENRITISGGRQTRSSLGSFCGFPEYCRCEMPIATTPIGFATSQRLLEASQSRTNKGARLTWWKQFALVECYRRFTFHQFQAFSPWATPPSSSIPKSATLQQAELSWRYVVNSSCAFA